MSHTDFPPHDYLTVRELADLLRLKERKVYDLAASGAVPCSRATGKLLFPKEEIRSWLERETSGQAAVTVRPGVVLGSHDPLLDWALRQSGCGLAHYFDGSLDGVARFVAGEGVAAGLHVRGASGVWNVPVVREKAAGTDAVLLQFATRARGLVYRSGEKITSLQDLAGKIVVPRQGQSGTDCLFRQLIAEEGIALEDLRFGELARTEDEAVEQVRRGLGDVAFGLEAVARGYGLEFCPVLEEEFALLVDRKAYFDAPLQRLVAFCSGDAFRARAASLGGYDVSAFGAVRWNG
ncbi:substrate-binding domain-containing protein [Tropicibacter sp. S64]|uniref:substrate-binding domain-containing protein n=1 Tax=Tropicibacter sp. S64 TaxID=3415122 RepID=UPI003C7D417C